MIFIFECTLPVDIFNTILSNEYTANNLVSFYIYSNNHSSHSAKQSYQTILRKRCSLLYIYSETKIKQDDHRSKYPSIFPGSSILLFSSVPSSHCIIESYRDRQRKKKSGFLGTAGFFDRLFPPRWKVHSNLVHREEKFNFSIVHAYLSSR